MSRDGQQSVESLTTSGSNTSEPGTATPCHHPSSTGRRFVRFGPFQIDLQKDLVTKSGSRIKLTAPLEVLDDSKTLAASASLANGKSRFFSIPRIVSLVLIGMVLGAMAAWISNHARAGPALNSEIISS